MVEGDQAGRVQEAPALGEDSRVGSAEAQARPLVLEGHSVVRGVTGSAPIWARFHPLVRRWFKETLGKRSDPQREGWPAIASGAHTLILAPTGTGKTLAAFLWELNELIVRGMKDPLPNAVHLLYISPLKALNNDIQRNLDRPLADLRERFAVAGKEFP